MAEIFYETPRDKKKVFQNPELLMMSEGKIVFSWPNTQPLYFYPLSWLDYLRGDCIHELQIMDGSDSEVMGAIAQLDRGRVHFEKIIPRGIEFALYRGHKVSVISDLSEIDSSMTGILSQAHLLRVRINDGGLENLGVLEGVFRENLLSCAKVYLTPEGQNYEGLIKRLRDSGFDMAHISRRLLPFGESNLSLPFNRQREIESLREYETDNFKVRLPKNLEVTFAERFEISEAHGNVLGCTFSNQRRVFRNGLFYPCYTQRVLSVGGFASKDFSEDFCEREVSCRDCACIYENDMYHEIKSKGRKVKKPSFALSYK